MTRRSRQLAFNYRTHGGARPGAGRKPVGLKAGVPHRSRAALASRHPVHVTVKLKKDLGNLRRRRTFETISDALVLGKDRGDFRVCHFSVQRDHIHLLCEAKHAAALSRGMQGLSIRIAKRLNSALRRKGAVFADRFHAQILKTPRQVRNALAYVLNNFRRHREVLGDVPTNLTDDRSSADWFDGFRTRSAYADLDDDAPVAKPRTWLLRVGWRRHRLITTAEVPG